MEEDPKADVGAVVLPNGGLGAPKADDPNAEGVVEEPNADVGVDVDPKAAGVDDEPKAGAAGLAPNAELPNAEPAAGVEVDPNADIEVEPREEVIGAFEPKGLGAVGAVVPNADDVNPDPPLPNAGFDPCPKAEPPNAFVPDVPPNPAPGPVGASAEPVDPEPCPTAPNTCASLNSVGLGPPIGKPAGYLASCSFSANSLVFPKFPKACEIVVRA